MLKSRFMKVAMAAARRSGRFIRSSVGRAGAISYKGRDNIVTAVDKKAESMILADIVAAYPGHSILSEESSPRQGDASHKWIIDPLDGTTNFARSFPFFCVSIAFEVNGDVEVGAVYDPMRDEMFSAERGRGAYLNGRRMRVSHVSRLIDSFLATGFSYGMKRKDRNVALFRKLLMRSLAIRRAGSAALDLCYVACGRFDGFWEMDLHPWDSAAGMLIVSEAGGKVTKFDGAAYTPYDIEILATNGRIHRKMSDLLAGK